MTTSTPSGGKTRVTFEVAAEAGTRIEVFGVADAPRETSVSLSALVPMSPSRPPTWSLCALTRSTSPSLLEIGRGTRRKMRQNLSWAIGYNSAALPIAAGVFVPAFGFGLRPEIAALTMSGSSIIVAVNAVLLKRLRLRTARPMCDGSRSSREFHLMATERPLCTWDQDLVGFAEDSARACVRQSVVGCGHGCGCRRHRR